MKIADPEMGPTISTHDLEMKLSADNEQFESRQSLVDCPAGEGEDDAMYNDDEVTGGRSMKDFTQAVLEDGRPDTTAEECVDFCLARLFEDDVHVTTDNVVEGLTFEELIGALLVARDGL